MHDVKLSRPSKDTVVARTHLTINIMAPLPSSDPATINGERQRRKSPNGPIPLFVFGRASYSRRQTKRGPRPLDMGVSEGTALCSIFGQASPPSRRQRPPSKNLLRDS